MHPSSPAPEPAQTALEFEEALLPDADAYLVQEAPPPSVSSPPEHIPVYTVQLRRNHVLSIRDRPIIRSPQDVANVVWDYVKDTDREHFVVLMLDSKNAVIGINTVSIGTLDSAIVHPREVFKPLILANAASAILSHNHPSGDPTPSAEDRQVTDRLVQGGQLLGIDVLDHVVIGDAKRFCSLKERGMM